MANFNFNKVILGGRLVATPELRQTPSGVMVTSFTIAVNRRFASFGGDYLSGPVFACSGPFSGPRNGILRLRLSARMASSA